MGNCRAISFVLPVVVPGGSLSSTKEEAAVRLGLENERLQAELLSRLEELRKFRAPIVETGTRSGACWNETSTTVPSSGSWLCRTRSGWRERARTDGDERTGSLLAKAIEEAQAALAELRELAHGFYPAILAEAGLGPALATLADAAPLPVEIRDAAAGRYPAPVETAVYLLVAEALDDAARRGASHAAVHTVRDDDDRLVVTVEDDGSERTSSMVQVADRVGAVGGSLIVGPRRIRAEIPCA